MGVDRGLLVQLRHVLRPLSTRIANVASRAVVHLVDDGKKQQLVQLGLLAGAVLDGGEHYHPYGFSSVPLGGSEAVVIFPNGDRSHPLVVAVSDRRHRPTGGQPGEVTMYNNAGASITMTKDGDIIAEPAPGREMLVRSPGGDAVDLATKQDLIDLRAQLLSWVPVAGDGGSALKTVLTSWLGAGPVFAWPAGTTVLKGE